MAIDQEKLAITVLYVEDEEMVRHSFQDVLNRHVENVLVATDGEEGLRLFKSEWVDVVITDIRMKHMDGLDMIREIRSQDEQVNIIVTSAFTDVDYFTEAIELKVDHFVIKPFDLDRMREILREITERLKTREQLRQKELLLEQYKRVVDESAIVSKADKEGIITFANKAFCQISGYSVEELVGQKHSIVRHPHTKKEVFEELWNTILGKRVWRGIMENRKKNGDSYFVDMKIFPILNEADEIGEFIAFRYDITKLVMKERELEKLRFKQMNEHIDKAYDIRLEALLNGIPVPAVIIDDENVILSFNRHFEDFFDLHDDKDVLKKLEAQEQDITELFEREEGYLYDDGVIDWKYLAENMGFDDGLVDVKFRGSSNKYHISLQRIPLASGEKRYIACMVPSCEV